jgi:hypothetical protein
VSAYDIHAWLEFGVAVAGAAAVLTGLVFVSVSINLERVLQVPGLPDRAGESVLMFVAVLIYSLFLMVPGQSTTALGVELLVSGLIFAAVLLLVAALGFRKPTLQPLSWKITRIVAALGCSVPAVVAGVTLMAEAGGGLYWLFAAIVLAFLAGVGNAWVLLVEIVRDERYRPVRDTDGT